MFLSLKKKYTMFHVSGTDRPRQYSACARETVGPANSHICVILILLWTKFLIPLVEQRRNKVSTFMFLITQNHVWMDAMYMACWSRFKTFYAIILSELYALQIWQRHISSFFLVRICPFKFALLIELDGISPYPNQIGNVRDLVWTSKPKGGDEVFI